MKTVVRRILRLACPPSLSVPELPPRTDTSTERARLRAAQAALQEAERELKQRAAETERARGMLTAAADAEAAQRAAEEALRAASKDWAHSGAAHEPPSNVKALEQAAQAAREKAYSARLLAEGMQDALDTPLFDSAQSRMQPGNILPAHAEAVTLRHRAADELHAAVRAVLLAQMQPVLDRAYQARATLEAEAPLVLGLFQVLKMSATTYPFAGDSSGLRQQLQQLVGPLPQQRQLSEFLNGGPGGPPALKQCWAEFGHALIADADAMLKLPLAATDPEAAA